MSARAYIAAGLGPGYRASLVVACRQLCGRRYTNANTKTDRYSNPQAYGYRNGEAYGYRNAETDPYRNAETDPYCDAEAYSYADGSASATRWNPWTSEDHQRLLAADVDSALVRKWRRRIEQS